MEGKLTASIVLDLSSAEHANKAIQNSIIFNGELLRTELYDSKAEIVHCYKCLGYGHIAKVCKADDACRWCGGKHRASTCEVAKKEKTNLWCKNCRSKGHRAHTRECPREKAESKRVQDTLAIKPYLYTIPPQPITIDLTPTPSQPVARKAGRPPIGAPNNVKGAAGYKKTAMNAQRTLQETLNGPATGHKRPRTDSGPTPSQLTSEFSFSQSQTLPATQPQPAEITLSQDSVFGTQASQAPVQQEAEASQSPESPDTPSESTSSTSGGVALGAPGHPEDAPML